MELLPNEILENIEIYLDALSYYALIQTAKLFYNRLILLWHKYHYNYSHVIADINKIIYNTGNYFSYSHNNNVSFSYIIIQNNLILYRNSYVFSFTYQHIIN